jgi:nucleoside transporter
MKLKTGFLLSAMMFLQYYIWGAWYVTMGTYMGEVLKSSGVDVGAAYSAGAIATIISPFFVGMIADKFFAAQKIMGVLHLVGAALLFYATKVDNSSFYWVILIYSLLYMPTIALSNSVAFAQMTDPGKQFPWIRVFGTLGWIVAGLIISQLGIEKTAGTFHVAAGVSVALGLLSFILPNTPPKGAGTKTDLGAILGKDAFVMLKEKSYLIFFISAILICIPLSFYYAMANPAITDAYKAAFVSANPGQALPYTFYVENKMSLGQASEVLFGNFSFFLTHYEN